MRVIISPAKKMKRDTDSFPVSALPRFLPEAGQLLHVLRAMSPKELQALWKCNDAITKLNVERVREMDLTRDLTPAVMAYEGIQYRYMAPGVLERQALDYLEEHLRILSGFYGLLSPFDGVVPYRLEMQAPLGVEGHRDLYGFWGEKPAKALAGESGLILNLASREYSRVVEPHLPAGTRFLTCIFAQRKGDKLVEKGTLCKMARGEMVRWLAENQIVRREDIPGFKGLGYRFSPGHSTGDNYVFFQEAE